MFTALLAAALTTLPLPDAPAPLRARVTDPAVIQAAVKEALATDPPPRGTGRVLSGDAHGALGAAFEDARVPGCLNPDALKHQQANIGGVPLGGILALPFWLTAIARGKCQ